MAVWRFMTSAYGPAEHESLRLIALSLRRSAGYTKARLLTVTSVPLRERRKMKKPSGAQTDGSAQSLVDVAAIDQLAKIVSQYDLSEVEISLGDLQVRLARERVPSTQASAAAIPQAAPSLGPTITPRAMEPPLADVVGAVKSPMVGTAYLRSSPEAKPFVELGSAVKAGDKLLLVEAMKTFNDIVAPHSGKVVSILVADGAPVEYDQPLMIIE
jgi:acetyl-CoA carboxylase biotin carboxyl carrier protein